EGGDGVAGVMVVVVMAVAKAAVVRCDGDVKGGDDGGEERVVVSAIGGNHGGGGVEAKRMEVVSWGCEMVTMMMRWLSFDGDEVMVEMMWWMWW
ncbi:hypothetical protein Tco_0395441, partial [Tanacetum coccineum]